MNAPKTPLDEAVAAYRAGRLEEADSLGRTIVETNPGDVWALHMLSLIARRRSDLDTEIEYLNRTLAVDPRHIESLVGLANALLIQGKPCDGLPLCERALTVNPSYPNAHAILGFCRQAVGDHAGALASFEKALAIQPGQAVVESAAGDSFRQTGRPGEALESYRRAIALRPNLASAHEGLGHLMLYRERHSEAVNHFTQALESEPLPVKRLLHLADAKGRQGLAAESIELINRALEVEPESGAAHCLMGFRLQDLGMFNEAIASFERSIQERPEQGQAYLGLFTSKKAGADDYPTITRMEDLALPGKIPPAELMRLRTAMSKAFDDLGRYEQAVANMDEANRIALKDFVGAKPFDRDSVASFVEQSIRYFTPQLMRTRQAASSDSSLPLLIVGLPRSGTTLLENILSRHSQIAAGGELRFWSDAHLDQDKGLLSLPLDPIGSVNFRDRYLSLLQSIGPAARKVTDKMPTNFFYMGVIHLLFPNARFIHCRRQPLDNCVSLYMTPFRHRPVFVQNRKDILSYYHQYTRLMNHWQNVLPEDAVLDVDYEHMVSDPEATTKRILSFSDLKWEEACLSQNDHPRTVNTPSNWQARQTIYRNSIDRWKNYEPWLGELKELLS